MKDAVKHRKGVMEQVRESSIQMHIERHKIIERFLPESSSYFCIVEIPANRYRFIGRQQEKMSGYANDELFARGVGGFLQSIHPEDVAILLEAVYPTIVQELEKLPAGEKTKVQVQYNYRFRRKSGEYLNLMEQANILELDDSGLQALLLCYVVTLHTRRKLPVKLTIKRNGKSGDSNIIYNKSFRSVPEELANITRREREILRNLALGKTSREIGDILFISRHTVDTHRRNLLRKLGGKSVLDLTRIALNSGLM